MIANQRAMKTAILLLYFSHMYLVYVVFPLNSRNISLSLLTHFFLIILFWLPNIYLLWWFRFFMTSYKRELYLTPTAQGDGATPERTQRLTSSFCPGLVAMLHHHFIPSRAPENCIKYVLQTSNNISIFSCLVKSWRRKDFNAPHLIRDYRG